MYHHQSIIRQGNHFLFFRCGWTVINGPWFEYLQGVDAHQDEFGFVKLAKLEPTTSEINPVNPPKISFYEEIVWERVTWHPGTLITPKSNPKLAWDNLPDPTKVRVHKFENLRERWERILNARARTGWRMHPDGRLPCFLNHIEWIENFWVCPARYQTKRGA